jgi:basic amino acid/polyamine antiporter, APA family
VEPKISRIKKESLDRTLKLSDVFAVGYGDLGASIFYALGITALYSLGATPISLLIAGFVFACTALTYAEMSSSVKESGGSATFTRIAFNDLISFIAGWALLLDFVMTIAISAFSVLPYLAFFAPLLKDPVYHIGGTIVLIGLLYLLNLKKASHSTKVSWVLTSLSLATQIVIVIIGAVYYLDWGKFIEHLRIGVSGSSWSPTWYDFWKGTAMAMVAYTGIESMAQLSSETKNAEKTVPRAMMLAMGVLIVMYIMIAMVALSVLTPQTLSTTYLDDPISGIVSGFQYKSIWFKAWVAMMAAVLLIVSSNAGLMGSSRLAYKMGEHYQLPRKFYTLHKKFKTPWVAMLFFAALASILVIASRGNLKFLADLYNFGAMLAFFAAHLALLMLRWKKPEMERPFRIPINLPFGKGRSLPISALVGVFATLSTWIIVIITKPDARYLGFAWLVIGIGVYYSCRKKHDISPTARIDLHDVAIPDFKKITVSKILVPTRGGAETETVQLACELAKINKATVVAVYVVPVPFSLSMQVPLYHQMIAAETALRRADAIAREYGVSADLRIVRSRTVSSAIINMLDSDKYDLLILGAHAREHMIKKGLGTVVNEILAGASCRIYISSSED